MVCTWAKSQPDKPAIICDGVVVSYEELENRFLRYRQALNGLGVKQGGRVIVAPADKGAFVIAMVAMFNYGAVAIPLVGESTALMAKVQEETGADAIVVDHGTAPAPAGTPTVCAVDIVPAPADLPPGTSPDDGAATKADDLAAVVFTSGTQGTRKGVMLSHANLATTERYLNRFLVVNEDIREYVTAPPFHAFGFGRTRSILRAGGTIVCDNGDFNAVKVLRGIEKHGCNALSGVASAILVLAERFTPRTEAIAGQLRWMEIGSQPMHMSQKQSLCLIFHAARMAFNYGMTEASRSTLIDFNHEVAHIESSGRAAPGTEIRICTAERKPLPVGTVGVVEMSGPHVAQGYWNNDTAWRKAYRDGWFRSDDIGYMDEEGYLFYVGRIDDMLNIGGELIAPTDLEHAFKPRLSGVEFVVVGTEDEVKGEVPVICFEPGSTVVSDWSALRESLVGSVPNKFLPQAGYMVQNLPRTAVGKVKRAELRNKIGLGQLAKVR